MFLNFNRLAAVEGFPFAKGPHRNKSNTLWTYSPSPTGSVLVPKKAWPDAK